MLSSYGKNLECHVRERYLKKISMVSVYRTAIPSEQLSSECLPPSEVSHLLSYLVLETGYYTNNQFKAFKSLEAYNYMVSGSFAPVQLKGKKSQAKLLLWPWCSAANIRSSCESLNHCRKVSIATIQWENILEIDDSETTILYTSSWNDAFSLSFLGTIMNSRNPFSDCVCRVTIISTSIDESQGESEFYRQCQKILIVGHDICLSETCS